MLNLTRPRLWEVVALLANVQGGKRRIVFVLDIVDRLPGEVVQKDWSDMRALFAAGASKPEETVLAVNRA